MSAVTGRAVKHLTVKFGSIASASLGFIVGIAIFDPSRAALAYATLWLLTTACLCAASLVGLLTDHLLTRLTRASIFPKTSSTMRKVRLSVERRLKGDRTEEEYRRVENGILVPVALTVLIALVYFMNAEWAAQGLVTVLFLWIAKGIFLFFNANTRHNPKSLIGWMCTGFFLALLFRLYVLIAG